MVQPNDSKYYQNQTQSHYVLLLLGILVTNLETDKHRCNEHTRGGIGNTALSDEFKGRFFGMSSIPKNNASLDYHRS